MNTTVPSGKPASFSVPEFGRSADGLTVARIGDAAYAMIPTTYSRHFLGSSWRLTKPLSDWKRSDFYGHGGDVADPSFAAPIYANLFDDEDGEGSSLIWSRPNTRRGD